jgi:hypothetical protein
MVRGGSMEIAIGSRRVFVNRGVLTHPLPSEYVKPVSETIKPYEEKKSHSHHKR